MVPGSAREGPHRRLREGCGEGGLEGNGINNLRVEGDGALNRQMKPIITTTVVAVRDEAREVAGIRTF